jgi:hypothetical protein
MGIRGPKSVDVERMRWTTLAWVHYFGVLRDGMPGSISKVKLGPWCTSPPLAVLREDEIGRPEKVRQRIVAGQMHYERMRFRPQEVVTHQVIAAKVRNDIVVSPTRQALKEAAALARKNKDWHLELPVLPQPKIWRQLKRASTVGDIRQVARDIKKTRHRYALDWRVIDCHARDLLKAKQLPNYPQSERPGSDNKRIWFFAKVLAGLELGIAPATAMKRLARWPSRQPPQSGQRVLATLSNLLNLADGVIRIDRKKGIAMKMAERQLK